jgi:hypothetical protein
VRFARFRLREAVPARALSRRPPCCHFNPDGGEPMKSIAVARRLVRTWSPSAR